MFSLARILALVVPVAVIAAFCLRPTPILGVDGESLAASVGAPGGEAQLAPCEQEEGDEDRWRCGLPTAGDPGTPGQTVYVIEVDGLGCWTARSDSAPSEAAFEGCVTIVDHIEATG